MNHVSRLMFLMIIGLFLAACQREPLPAATPVVLETVASMESTAIPPSVTMPAVTSTRAEPAPTATPAATATIDATATATGTPTASPTRTAVPLTVTEELTFELVAHEGGEVRSVAVDGSVAYAGVGPRLVALDVSNPASPQAMGRSEVLPGLVDAVVLEQDGQRTRAYVAAGDEVVALALGADGELTVEGSVAMPGYTRALALADGMLYAGGIVPRAEEEDDDTGYVAAVAVRQPDGPRLLDLVTLSRPVRALALDEDALYVGHNGGLSAALVSNGEIGDPRRLGGVAEVYALQVVGSTLLVGDYMKLHAFAIGARTESGLPRAEHLWRVEASPDLFLGLVEGIAVRGDTVYTVGNLPAGSYIPSRLAIPAPTPFEGEARASGSALVALSGNHLFVAEGDLLEIYDVSRPGELVEVGGYGAALPAAGDLAFEQTPSGESILYLYDGSPFDTAWERLFSYRLPLLEPLGQLTIEGAERDTAQTVRARFDLALGESSPHAYLTTADGVYQIDIGNPAAPRITAHEPYAEEAFTPIGLLVQGDQVYLVPDAGLRVMAFTPGDGVLERTAALDALPGDALWAAAAADNRLYVTASQFGYPEGDWLHVVDAGGEELSLLTSIALPGLPGWGALATNGNVVATTVEGRLLLINISTTEEPVLAASVALPGPSAPVYSPEFHQGRLFVVAGDQLLVVDVTDPAHPRAVGAAALPSALFYYSGAHLAVADSIVAVALGEVGVLVFEIR